MTVELPQRINVIKTITYDVEAISAILKESGVEDPEIGEILEVIEDYAKDDFSCGWGHVATIDDLIFQDENGNEL